MSTRFLPNRRASSLKAWTLASVLLFSLASLAWSLRSEASRVSNSEEARPSEGMRDEGGGMRKAGVDGDGEQALTNGGQARTNRLGDEDGDGMPDGMELRSFNDRENFRRWFTAVAEMQFYRLSEEWNTEQRDCAGLVRFAWREALRKHDRSWFQRLGEEYEQVAPDVGAYTLETSPLGERLFRTGRGRFMATDLRSGKFSEFADARTLEQFNCEYVGRDRRHAQPGDLLFFYQPWVQKLPYHVMIFLGQSHNDSEGASDWVVYHTGSTPTDEGVVKKVRLSVLDHHPDPRWRPVDGNRNFLGFYRLKILE